MTINLRLNQKLTQTLKLSPQLQQAIKLLQLGNLELQDFIESELKENPILEFESSETHENNESQNQSEDLSFDINTFETSYDPMGNSFSSHSSEEYDLIENTSDRPNLVDHLNEQLAFKELNHEQTFIVKFLIGNLDASGYLRVSSTELAQRLSVNANEIEAAVQVLQSFDPCGVAARDLAECLLIQLKNQGAENSLAARIILNCLAELEKRKYKLIAEKESVSEEEVLRAIAKIRTLDPNPAQEFHSLTANYITPDVQIEKVNGEYTITLNDQNIPLLKINDNYLEMLKDHQGKKTTEISFISKKLQSANWLIKSVEQRKLSILKVAQSIVKHQRDFFDFGIKHMKPLTLKEVAEDVGVHESTVSRVTSNKFANTPQGLLELKFFFSSGINSSAGEVSSHMVKNLIQDLIAQENPKKPISDQKISDYLKNDKNINVARRTVAKYREELGLPSSNLRKKVL